MGSFDDFYDALLELVKARAAGMQLGVERNGKIIRIFGDGIGAPERARDGLREAMELALSTAEHHPLWGLLHNCSIISDVVLEKWHKSLTAEEIDEIEWSIKELQNACEKLRERQT